VRLLQLSLARTGKHRVSKVVLTQDVPGEREWLATIFPGHTNFETESSGRWGVNSPALDYNDLHIYEIPWNDHNLKLDNLSNTYKSIFTVEASTLLNDNINWAYSDQFITTQKFSTFQNLPNQYYQMLHVARSGTVFVESLLKKQYWPLSQHVGISPDKTAELEITKQINDHSTNLTVALVYTTDFWRCLTSNVLGLRHGWHHYDSNFDWSKVDSIVITDDNIKLMENILINTWNFWCNLRNKFPNLDFYFLDGSAMISKYSQYTNHSAIKYDKTTLIKNYHEAKELFESQYLKKWNTIAARIQKHLTIMGCKLDLDNIQCMNESI